MVVRHVLAWQWRDSTSEDAIDRALDAVVRRFTEIPGVVRVQAGSNRSTSDREFTHYAEIDLGSWSDLEAYVAHEVHRDVARALILPILDSTVVLDYEVSEDQF